MKYLQKLLFVNVLCMLAVQLFAQGAAFEYGDDINDLKSYAEKAGDVYWLNEGEYTTEATALDTTSDRDYDHPFNGSLGISDGVTLTSTGLDDGYPDLYTGINIDGDINQTGGTVNAFSNGDVGVFATGDYSLSGGIINATAEGSGSAVYLQGDFNITAGNINIFADPDVASGTSGIHLSSGDFYIQGGNTDILLNNTTNGTAYGITLDTGIFYMSSGRVTAVVTNTSGGYAYGLEAGDDFYMSGGYLKLDTTFDSDINSGATYGVRLTDSGSFNMTGGAINSIVNKEGAGLGTAYGIYANKGFTLESGFINLDVTNSGTGTWASGSGYDNNATGIYIASGGFTMDGGKLVIKSNNEMTGSADYSHAFGIFINDGNFTMDDGISEFTAINNNVGVRQNSSGVLVLNGNFIIQGGILTATAISNSSDNNTFTGAIMIDNYGDFDVEGGKIIASVTNTGNNNASGLFYNYGNFNMSDGTITASSTNTGNGKAYGIYSWNGSFNMSGGTITASVTNTGSGTAYGIYAQYGDFLMSGGTLILNHGIAVRSDYGMLIDANATISPVIDFSTDTVGKISAGGVIIVDGATLAPKVKNALAYTTPQDYAYITSAGTRFYNSGTYSLDGRKVNGNFAASDIVNTPYFNFTSTNDGGNDVYLTATKIADVSDFATGDAKNFIEFLENNGDIITGDLDVYGYLSEFYDELLETTDAYDIAAAAARGFLPNTATRFVGLMNNHLDTAFAATSNNLTNDLEPTTGWSLWIAPNIGSTSYRTDELGFEDADFHSKGGTLGLAKRYNQNALSFSLGGFYGNYDSDESMDSADLTTFTGVVSYRMNPIKSAWIETSLGYGYNKIDQTRDSFGGNVTSDVRADMARAAVLVGIDHVASSKLTVSPSLGIGYTYTKQDAYDEFGAGVALSVDGQTNESLKPKVGVKMDYAFANGYALTLGGSYSYEMLDTRSDLSVGIDGLRGKFTVNGEESRHSGTAFIGLTCQATNNMYLTGQYGISLTETATTQNFGANLRIMF